MSGKRISDEKMILALTTCKDIATASNELGITRQAIYNYESDTRIPRDEIKVNLCQYYGVGVEEIFFDQKSNEKLLKL